MARNNAQLSLFAPKPAEAPTEAADEPTPEQRARLTREWEAWKADGMPWPPGPPTGWLSMALGLCRPGSRYRGLG